jgi:hypothetical protein
LQSFCNPNARSRMLGRGYVVVDVVADGTRRDSLASAVTDVDHVRVWQTVGKLRRRRGLVMSGEPREPGYRGEDWMREARRVLSSVQRS